MSSLKGDADVFYVQIQGYMENGGYYITWSFMGDIYIYIAQINVPVLAKCCGPGSSVGIATDYGLDGPGSNPGWDEIFRPSRPALGPTQAPVKWVPGLSRGQSAAGACC